MSKKTLLLGDEALALGALHAGLSGVYAYPGTPSTEITEFIQAHPLTKERNIHCQWSCNEKTAMEAALGASYAGKRAMVCMKHVGMNVCADCFVNSAMTGSNGGLVVVACDDPSMHSSQNEQDSRFYADFAMVPCLEPSSQQEAYDMVRFAFNYSEKYSIPVLMRLTTRMAHSRSVVEVGQAREQNPLSNPTDPRRWILLPANARVRNQQVIKQLQQYEEDPSALEHNKIYEGGEKAEMGIIAAGIGWNYLMENIVGKIPFPVLKITQYPIPKKLIKEMADTCSTLLVVEEGQPFIEQRLRGYLPQSVTIKGRLDGTLPRTGELTPDILRNALGIKMKEACAKSDVALPRPPALCMGCGHRDFYTALNKVIKNYPTAKVFSDIGCYTLGALAPFHAINSCVDMGASITMAIGASESGLHPAVAVIGDSTFTHSGMTGLLDAVNMNANITVCISDNLTTGMTGGQDSAAFGRIENICLGIGVEKEHIRLIVPLPKNYAEMEETIRQEIEYNGVSVVVCRRECIQTAKRHLKKENKK